MAQTENRHKDVKGIVASTGFILLGVVAWIGTNSMADPDSYVFPRAVIIVMIACGILKIVTNLVRGTAAVEDPSAGGSDLRRVCLVAIMLGGAFLMPWIGFPAAGFLIFGALTFVAMFDAWTRQTAVIYTISALAVVGGFYFLFAELLYVPFPVGWLWE